MREANIVADVVKILLDSDWQTDPPPGLVIEIDVTTYTAAEDYLLYQVPEVWLFKSTGLSIYALDGQTYVLQSKSRYFPEINLVGLMSAVLEEAATQGTGAALRRLRQQFVSQ
nr:MULTISPECIES: Uma2 family endonuclease [unclassified Thermosynechococcus]